MLFRSRDYSHDPHTNEFTHHAETGAIARRVQAWFDEFGRTATVANPAWTPMGLGYEI